MIGSFKSPLQYLLKDFQREREEEMGSLSGDMPDDPMIKILAALPVKSICKFKAVSKSWESLLSSHHFAINHSLSTSHSLSLSLHYQKNGSQMFCASSQDISDPRSYTRTRFQHQDLCWVACNNGMVCSLIVSKMGSFFTVANPLIQTVSIPISNLEFHVYDFGFYFEPITLSYKILVNIDRKVGAFFIFDSSVGGWRPPRNETQIQLKALFMMVCVGSTCYGISSEEQGERLIMGLEMEREEWESIQTPAKIVEEGFYKIQERDGRLCLVQVIPDSRAQAQIWVLSEGKKWTQLMNLDLKQLGWNKLEQSVVGFADFLLFPHLWIDDRLLLGIKLSEEVAFNDLYTSDLQVVYNCKSGQFGEIVVDADISCVLMYKPTLFTCQIEP
ncbi:hypothetical protein AMTRI_Chr11g157200 [Amborella trichopoda]